MKSVQIISDGQGKTEVRSTDQKLILTILQPPSAKVEWKSTPKSVMDQIKGPLIYNGSKAQLYRCEKGIPHKQQRVVNVNDLKNFGKSAVS